MKKTGIIAAMQEEMNEIKKLMNKIKKVNIYELTFFEGILSNKEVILAEAGIGKVNAARVTQILIDKFNVNCIINVGSAGALSSDLNIGDIVIGEKLVQHDFDITAFNHPKGYISNVGVEIQSDKDFVLKIEKIAEEMQNETEKIKIGTIATGDIFCTDIKMKNKVKEIFGADAIEMEGAAIAQVCKLCNIPFIIIRGISDSPNGNNAITFDKYLTEASMKCAKILERFLKGINLE